MTTSYFLEGDRVIKETHGSDTLWFYYDASGSVIGFELNGTAYFYVKNLQGDIIGILNNSGTLVVEYKYDSWGKLMNITGSAASSVGVKNPYRYRGYRYDTETELYYLQSRYYDPEVKRFVNADILLVAETDIPSYNLFLYCINNPLLQFDNNGMWPSFVESIAKIVSIAAVVVCATASVIAVSAVTAGTGSAMAVTVATSLLGASLSGINGAVANANDGNSYLNGYVGGFLGGSI